MRQNSLQKTRSKRGRQRIVGQGRQGQQAEPDTTDRTTGKRHRTRDDNPTADKGKTDDTIYRGETGVRHQTVTRQEWLRAGAGN